MTQANAESLGYADLTPPVVLAALDAVGLRGDGRLLQLNSYENRVFQVFLEDGRAVVAKFYRPGRWSDAQIIEEHVFAQELAEREVPVVPPLSLHVDDRGEFDAELIAPSTTLVRVCVQSQVLRFSVSERRAGRAPELDDPATLAWLGRFIARLHAVGAQRRFEHRRSLTPQTFGFAARDAVLASGLLPIEQEPAWRSTVDATLELVEERFADCASVRQLRLHGDCHPGNVLWREEGPHFVDLDDACMGPAVQDLWMLLSGDADAMGLQLRCLLDGYRQFRDFDTQEIALIEPLRSLRMIHHSAWLATRWSDPSFPPAFPWFGTPAYWSQQITHLREQIEVMQTPMLRV